MRCGRCGNEELKGKIYTCNIYQAGTSELVSQNPETHKVTYHFLENFSLWVCDKCVFKRYFVNILLLSLVILFWISLLIPIPFLSQMNTFVINENGWLYLLYIVVVLLLSGYVILRFDGEYNFEATGFYITAHKTKFWGNPYYRVSDKNGNSVGLSNSILDYLQHFHTE